MTAFAAEPIPEDVSKEVLKTYYEQNFDTELYAEKNPDLARVIEDDSKSYLNHYLANGIIEGRRTGNFDCVAFVWNNKEWFRQHGLEKDNPFFNAEKYRKNNPDLNAVYGDDMQAYVEHYITFGITEGRCSESSFDIFAFSKIYPDTGLRTNVTPEELLNSYKAELAKNRVEEKKNERLNDQTPDDDIIEIFDLGPVKPIPLY